MQGKLKTTVRTWVEGAREVAYHAEDVLETYVVKVQSKRKGGILNILKRYACLLNECIVYSFTRGGLGKTTLLLTITQM
ncbi:unnamed protein product [Ilex paraguariensis]|uniref:Disease resistance N-terminal domain-containing protein n=1 Tax=Ilex paraguariensis TaxID=185542 RepID=A0ABC8SK82_9AQUA